MGVKLRKRKQGGGQTWLYLDIISNGKRWSESLGLHLGGDKIHNRETMALAKSIEAKRQLELQSAPFGYVPEFKKSGDFIEYFGRLAASRDKCWRTSFLHLKQYQPTPLPFRLVDAAWLEGFKSYLANHVSANTAGTYYSKIKAALKPKLYSMKEPLPYDAHLNMVKNALLEVLRQSYYTRLTTIPLSKAS